MSREPLVSVIIPVYECNAYIGAAIASVVEQSYRNVEIIVVDGGPGEETKRLLAPYWNEIRYVYQEPRGVSAARNLGIRHAHGQVIAFQDADDIWLPEKLELQVRALERHPDVGLVFTETLTFDDTGVVQKSFSKHRFDVWYREHELADSDVGYGSLYQPLLLGNCVNTSSVMVRKQVLDEVGDFDETFKTSEDYDLWLRIASKYPVAFINRVLCQYRIHSEGLSGAAAKRYIRWGQDGIRVREKHLRNNWIPTSLKDLFNEELSRRCWGLGWNLFGDNRFSEARRFLSQGIRYQPFSLKLWIYWCASFLPLSAIEAVRRLRQWRRMFRLHAEPAARNLDITRSGPGGPRGTI